MVGLSDIPCVGKLVDRISDAAVDTIFRGFHYMLCYKDLVKTLDSQVEKANTEEERVSTKVFAERANGKLIKPHVDKWQKEAEEIMESAEKFAEIYKTRHSWRCIQCLPIPNPISLFRLGRAAVQKTERLTKQCWKASLNMQGEMKLLRSPNFFRLEVSNCKLLEVVVEDARGDETSGTNDKTITLPLLENIELEHLPNLKSFSGDESMAFNMLQLKNFSLVGCPGVENFTCLNTHTGNGYVRTDGDEWKQVPDLNDYIKSLFKKEDVAVPENQRDSKMKSLREP